MSDCIEISNLAVLQGHLKAAVRLFLGVRTLFLSFLTALQLKRKIKQLYGKLLRSATSQTFENFVQSPNRRFFVVVELFYFASSVDGTLIFTKIYNYNENFTLQGSSLLRRCLTLCLHFFFLQFFRFSKNQIFSNFLFKLSHFRGSHAFVCFWPTIVFFISCACALHF